jgi:CO/xanthine dehydrogenase Mo-binding subunit
MGVGYGLYEEIKIANGNIRTPSFATYIIPTSMDIPIVDTIIAEENANTGPFGAKGLGEPPLVAPAAAIANAVSQAIGVRISSLPLTPEKVLKALQEAGKI